MLNCYQYLISAQFSSAKGHVWCVLIRKYSFSAVMQCFGIIREHRKLKRCYLKVNCNAKKFFAI